jgi:tellurite resistance protein
MQLERAMMIAQQRNNLHTQGTTLDTHSSFYAFSDEDIISRAKTLGISMGSNSKSERAAAQLIKETEKQRVLTFLKNDKTLEEEATLPPCIVVSRASDLCEDLDDFSDENLDEHIDLLISHSVVKQTRKKSLMIRQMLGEVTDSELKEIIKSNFDRGFTGNDLE